MSKTFKNHMISNLELQGIQGEEKASKKDAYLQACSTEFQGHQFCHTTSQ